VLVLLVLSSALLTASAQQTAPSRNENSVATSKKFVGSEVCAQCHAEIYKSYAGTAMAQASGPATEGLLAGDFQHAPSRVHYRVYTENDQAWMSFERSGDNGISGKKQLLYFIGSGHRGRTYLFSVDSFVFEAPINWYGQQQLWDMAPAYQKAREIPMNLPAVSSCLSCHTSDSQAPILGTENKYASPLFVHAGITCERCHGPGNAHAEARGPIVNPAKLPPDRRDAVCMQCHFEGSVAIQQPGHTIAEFQAGENLSDYVRYFILTGTGDARLGALSQTEALAQSVCKRKSGDKMACTSCHDPHFIPKKEEKAIFYRSKCLSCHGGKFGVKHKRKRPDCTACHMPPAATADIAHTQATDHRILRDPKMSLPASESQTEPRLIRFSPNSGNEDTRSIALAWESLAQGGTKSANIEAGKWLQKAVQETPNDPGVLAALGYEEQKRGLVQKAREHYLRALQIDPLSNEAAINLGVIEAQAGNVEQAIQYWQGPFDRIPSRSEVGMNLTLVYCATGQLEKAQATLTEVLKFNPDLTAARNLQRQLSDGSTKCGAR
jgi:tetratricopeptide (TPR) repeat protein